MKMENEKKMKQQILEAKEGVRLSIYTGMLEYGHIDRMTTRQFYKAFPGSRILLLDTVYEFALAVYMLERDDTYMYTYAYQENECWVMFDDAVKPNTYYQTEYVFDRECYFRVNLRRCDGRAIDASEADHINHILIYESDLPESIGLNNNLTHLFEEEIKDTTEKINSAKEKHRSKAFLLLTDSHYVVNGTWEDTVWCIKEVNKRAPFDSIIHLGDLTDGMICREVNYHYVDIVKKDLLSLDKPVYLVIGNHDTNYFKGNPERFSKEEQYWLYHNGCCDGAVRNGHALYYYKDSVELTEDVFRLIIQSVYWQIKHVRANINFSRIAVRNNHAITETLALYLVGLLFPQFPESGEWKKKGKKWFEEEIKYQVAEDGTYLQFSMNYHRVVVQLLTWAITLADRNGERFCDEVYKRAYQSVNFLYQCQDDSTGWLSNYGSNDGALFFKLNDCDYRDYRPQLDALYYLLTSEHLYDRQYEDREWYLCEWKANRQMYPPIKKQFGCISFDKGGYYCIREKDTFSFIRCGRHKDRPAHADNLHLDIWYQGENCLFDGGSYKYNTTEKLLRYFMGTESHNTIMLEGHDQMLKGDRFIWYNWSQAEWSSLKETEDTYIFEGKVSCFTYLNKKIKHYRKIVKWKNTCKWEIEDCIDGNPKNMNMRQLWHTNKDNLSLESNGETIDTEQLCSNYYGQTTKCRQIEFQTKNSSIKTILQFI